MLYDQFKVLVKGMKSIWTQGTFLPDRNAVAIWYELLKDIPYEHASVAVQRYASTNTWPPTPADIRKQVVDIQDDSTDWGAAWQTVIRAIGRYGMYGESEAIASMDDMTRKTIRRLGWKMICESEQKELTAIRANFRMIYEQMQRNEREQAQLPDTLKQKIEQIANEQMRIGHEEPMS